MREEEAHQENQSQPDSPERQEDGDVVEEPEGVGESTSTLRSPEEDDPSMDVDEADTQQSTSDSTLTISPEEEQMLMGESAEVAGELAKLQVSSPTGHEPEGGETSQ